MTEERTCPVCGMRAGIEAVICPNCGHILDDKLETDSILTHDELTFDDISDLEETESPEGDSNPEDLPSIAPLDDTIEDDTIDEPLLDELLDNPEFELDDLSSEMQSAMSDDENTDERETGESVKASDTSTQTEIVRTSHMPPEYDEIPKVWDAPVVSEVASDDVREGEPFREVDAPVVQMDEDEMRARMTGVAGKRETHEAMTHLFPPGRGVTSSDFIDAVVSKPTRIGSRVRVRETEVPSCPNCGSPLTDDGFQYPSYVFEALGRARMEAGLQHLREDRHEKAIESFEKARMLFEKAGNQKLVEEARRRVDEGYLAMGAFHYAKAEEHLRGGEFEWAIVQFKKAREIYMLTADVKMRARSSERVRECYSEWGKSIEAEGDALAKSGAVRDALEKYRQAAEKYKTAEDTRRLRSLEKKIKRT